MSDICELCNRAALELAYVPESTTRGLKVHVCEHCGLLQSLPRIDRATRAPAAVSGGADWGNVRYGKGFRTRIAIAALSRHIALSDDLALLDVGSNRGSFARAFLELCDDASIVAVEPDERVADSCKDLPRTELIHARIEDAALESERFDIVHSCHTIEHLAHPAKTLRDHWRVLKPGGLLVLDAPNVALLGSDDIVEEWFIDKHLYHFSARTMMRMVTACGFDIVEAPDLNDAENLLIVARKVEAQNHSIAADPREVASACDLVAAYGTARARNLSALTLVAAEISRLAPKGVAVWGAGRLFDALVVHGGFDPAGLSLLVDKHLQQHMGERHGAKLRAPADIATTKPGAIIVMSRGFATEIIAEARNLAPNAEIYTYSDLLNQARTARAA